MKKIEENEKDMVLVLDFGAQYSQLIARRIREFHVYSKIVPFNITADEIKKMDVSGIVLSGGPASVNDENSPSLDPEIIKLGIPILGICYGLQTLAVLEGGTVQKPEKREYGTANLKILEKDSSLLKNINQLTQVWMSHGDSVTSIPEGYRISGSTDNCPCTVIENEEKKIYGVQFHPEVKHTIQGTRILKNFVLEICKCKANWTMDSFIDSMIKKIKDEVGDKTVLCGLSGGVDSSVAATLIHRAIGDNLICVFVNNGLLRKNETEDVKELFGGAFKMRLHYVDAEEQFLNALKGVSEPEAKRKIIGKLFVDTFYQEAKNIEKENNTEISYLAQGTLYPDVIESRSATGGPSATIKSHHNVGGLPKDLKWKLLEPLKELFKDEVRVLGKELGLPDDLINRHPFPGPGLGVRCIGELTKERLDTLRDVDAIFIDEIRKAGLYLDIWQALACLLPVKSVGVQGDERTYEEVCSLRAVTSEDAMTADWFEFPPEVLKKASSRICNEVSRVNRVLYDITSKPPGTIEWE